MLTPNNPSPETSIEPPAITAEDANIAAPQKHDYYSWTRAIGEYYFRPEFDGKVLRIAFDDDVALQIGRSIGADVTSFESAVANIANPHVSEVFRTANKGDRTAPHYPFLGVLAAQVLTASRMGVHKDVDATSFWGPFEKLFAGGEVLRASSRERFGEYWRGAQRHYREHSLGLLMLQDDPANVPLRGKVNINFPLWQVMLREADRAQLRTWFQTQRTGDYQSPAALLSALLRSADGFNKTLRTTLQEASRDASLSHALAPMFDEIRSDVLAFTGRAQSRREKGRLRLVGLRTLQCFLQQRDESGRWFDVSTALETNDVVYGIIDDVTQTWWRGDDRVAFIDGGIDAFVAYRGDVSPGSVLFLLCSDDDSRVVAALTKAAATLVAIDARLRRMHCMRISVAPERDDDLLAFFGCTCLGERLLSLTGGLAVRNQYLSTCLPRIRTTRPDVPVLVDGHLARVSPDGLVDISLAASTDAHVVSTAKESIEFNVLAASGLADSDQEPTYGIALGPAGVMRTTSMEQFETPAVGMLVGAEFWDA